MTRGSLNKQSKGPQPRVRLSATGKEDFYVNKGGIRLKHSKELVREEGFLEFGREP